MKALNLFIVNDNESLLLNLKSYLRKKYGNAMLISVFDNEREALKKIDRSTRIVIMDSEMDNENGNAVQQAIKKINSNAEVIMLASNEEIGKSIDTYLTKRQFAESGTRAKRGLEREYTFPGLAFVHEFMARRFLIIFLFVFVLMGFGIYYVLNL